jgi:DNA repair protein SbcD/Mre11
MLKILHTSDLQLDAPFEFLGEKGAQYRQQLRTTFQDIVDLAGADGYHLLLIVGDLFDTNQPSHTTVEFVKSALARLEIPICILPGNHDCYDNRSIYRREGFGDHVHVLTETPTYLDFPHLDLQVAGNPLISRQDTRPVLRDIVRSQERKWFVVLAHGSLQIPGFIDNAVRPILPAQIEDSGANYVALGDWHGFRDCSQGSVKAYYCGAPEPSSITQRDTGFAVSVSLSEAGVDVQRIRVGKIRTAQLSFDIWELSVAEIATRIREHSDPNCMLSVTLDGLKSLDTYVDVDDLCAELVDEFYWLRIEDSSATALECIDPAEYPETHVIGQYVNMLADKIEHAEDEHAKRIAEQALQVGVALLKGREILS